MKQNKKNWIYPLIVMGFILILIGSCKKEDNNSTKTTVVATEEWGVIMDNDSANYGQETFEKKTDGSITSKGTWHVQGVDCIFQNGKVTINDTAISFTANGTATNPSAPAGYNTSPFTLSVSGSAHNGESFATWSINFSTNGWPPTVQGIGNAIRKSGSGVAN